VRTTICERTVMLFDPEGQIETSSRTASNILSRDQRPLAAETSTSLLPSPWPTAVAVPHRLSGRPHWAKGLRRRTSAPGCPGDSRRRALSRLARSEPGCGRSLRLTAPAGPRPVHRDTSGAGRALRALPRRPRDNKASRRTGAIRVAQGPHDSGNMTLPSRWLIRLNARILREPRRRRSPER